MNTSLKIAVLAAFAAISFQTQAMFTKNMGPMSKYAVPTHTCLKWSVLGGGATLVALKANQTYSTQKPTPKKPANPTKRSEMYARWNQIRTF